MDEAELYWASKFHASVIINAMPILLTNIFTI